MQIEKRYYDVFLSVSTKKGDSATCLSEVGRDGGDGRGGWRRGGGQRRGGGAFLRVEHGAVVVDEAGADELVSGLGGPQAELHHPLLSCRTEPGTNQSSERRRRDTATLQQHHQRCVCVCVCV